MAQWYLYIGLPIAQKESIPYPTGTFNIKVKAEICFRQRVNRRHAGKKASDKNDGVCCHDLKQYSDRNGICKKCAEGSSPRLNGYFCESCPPGHSPRDSTPSSYGCQPCPVDTFKALEGNSGCLPCDMMSTNMNTNGTTGNSFCIIQD